MFRKSFPKTAALVLLRIGMLLGVLVAVLLAIGAEKKNVYPREEILWSGRGGIYETDGHSEHPRLYILRDREGAIIDRPVFARWRDTIVYWSAPDNALCFVSPDGSRRWVNVTQFLGEQWRTASVETTQDRVFMNLERENSVSVGAARNGWVTRVITVDPFTGASSPLIGARWVDSGADSNGFAELMQDGDVEVTSGHKRWLGLRAVSDCRWAYDCTDSRGGVQKSWLQFDGPSGRVLWRSWEANSDMSLRLEPGVHQVWCQSHEPFRARSRLSVWSYSGSKVADGSYPLQLGRPLMAADSRVDEVLHTLGTDTATVDLR